jgi:hypothetical protein
MRRKFALPRSDFSDETQAKAEREAARAEAPRLTPEAVDTADSPRTDLDWVPMSMVPLFATAAFDDLSDDQRRRYNHYYALQLSEEFLWLEHHAIVPPLEALLQRGDLPPPVRTLIETFVRDERSHSAAIERLLERARPDLYARRHDVLFRPPWRVRYLTAAMARMPTFLGEWSLFVGALEEQTITIAHLYRDAGDDVDPLFSRVHALHAQDEARHCQYDALIADGLVSNEDTLATGVGGAFLAALFRAYYDVEWGFAGPIRRLVIDFPELQPRSRELLAVAAQARHATYGERLLDPATAPITVRNAERFPVLGRAIRRLSRPLKYRNLFDGFGRRR